MRAAFISDLHGMLGALDDVLADIDGVGVDVIVCLGDIVDMGPRPGEVIDRLRERGIPCVRGNHDALDEFPSFPLLAEVEEWTRDQLSDEQRDWLGELPADRRLDLDGSDILCVHGSPRDDMDQVLDDTPVATLEAWWGDRTFDVMVCGHTHVQLLRRIDDRVVVNVGSVGQPFRKAFRNDGPPRCLPWSEYTIVSHDSGVLGVDLRRVPLDWERFESNVRSRGFPQPEVWLGQWR